MEEEQTDRRFLREQRILAATYVWEGTTANIPRNPCLDIPFPDQRFEEAAVQGYCTVHRHPLFVEYIEAVSELLMSALQKADAIMDIAAAKAALACDSNRTEAPRYMLGRTWVEWIDFLYQEIIAVPLSGLRGSYKRRYDYEKGEYIYKEIICKGHHPSLSLLNGQAVAWSR